MFHHLRRLWRPEGRSKPLPSRHCCGNDSSGPPSFGGVPRGPSCAYGARPPGIPMLPPVCEMLKHPTPQRNHAMRLGAWPVFRVVVRRRRNGGAKPPTDLFADHETLKRFWLVGKKSAAPPGFAPYILLRQDAGSPSRAQPCTGGRFQRAPHLPQTPPHFATLRHRGGALVEAAPPHRLPPVPSLFFLASALCLIS